MVFSAAIAAAVLATGPNAVELTVYNQGFALVKEARTLELKAGIQTVMVEDVAQLIEASSVGIRSISAPGSFSVLEQNYQYDLISTTAILNKAVGGTVILNRILPNGTKEQIVGTLLSSPTSVVSRPDGGSSFQYNGMVIRTQDGRILLNPTGEVEVASIPDGLISKPTLVWELESEKAGSNTVELSYLTNGMSWNADYVLAIDGLGRTADLKGWVTINNQSGATFNGAKLKLLAGDVQRVREQMARGGFGGGAMAMEAKADRGFEQEQFSEYHLYTLGRPATVRQNEMKQISLLEGTNVPVRKRLVVDAMRNYRGYRSGEGEVGTGPIKPQVRIELTNDQKSGLGMPLPKGKVKVFQRDSKGSLQMLGEDNIDHTPRDEQLSLVVGHAFDIVAERHRTHFEWIMDGNVRRGARESFEIELRNRKDVPETVEVIERYWGQWSVTKKNQEFKKLDSDTLVFTISLKAGETQKVIYTVETRW